MGGVEPAGQSPVDSTRASLSGLRTTRQAAIRPSMISKVITWIGSFSGPTVDSLTQYLSIIDHYDDFGKGVIDTTHVIYYLSFITFGLFLTAKSVDSERWRA